MEEYWSGVAQQLQIEAETFNRLVAHNGESGRANEIALLRMVENLLPSSVGVGTGIVIDSNGGRSKQMDLLIYDRASQPQLLAHSTQLLFPVETVHAVVEVKTSVSEDDVLDAGRKFESIDSLSPTGRFKKPSTAFFGYIAKGAPATRVQQINQLPVNHRPDVSCILNPGAAPSDGSGSKVGLIPRHALDGDGNRISGTWEATEIIESMQIINGHAYPVSRLKPYSSEKHVFEPGRALLLFADALIGEISSRINANGSWLAHYLTDLARETYIPDS